MNKSYKSSDFNLICSRCKKVFNFDSKTSIDDEYYCPDCVVGYPGVKEHVDVFASHPPEGSPVANFRSRIKKFNDLRAEKVQKIERLIELLLETLKGEKVIDEYSIKDETIHAHAEVYKSKKEVDPIEIREDGSCDCDCGRPCPLGRVGMELRCTESELILANIPVVRKVKPPEGIKPNSIWIEDRIEEITAAIKRYSDAKLTIPDKWISELLHLQDWQKEIK